MKATAMKPHLQRQPRFRWVFSWLFRILAAYTVYAVLFTCPPDARNDPTASRVCRRWNTLWHTTRTCTEPVAQRTLESWQPFLEKSANVYQQYLDPPARAASHKYNKQVGPWLHKAQRTTRKQIRLRLGPYATQLKKQTYDKYRLQLMPTIAASKKKYDKNYAPTVKLISKQASKLYHGIVYPAINNMETFSDHLFVQTYGFAKNELLPQFNLLGQYLMKACHERLLPRLYIIWKRHISPQMDKISDRISEYKQRQQISQVVKIAKSDISSMSKAQKSKATSQSVQKHEQLQDMEKWIATIQNATNYGIDSIESISEEVALQVIERANFVTSGLLQGFEKIIDTETSHGEQLVVKLAKENSGDEIEKFLKYSKASGQRIHEEALAIRNYLNGLQNDTMDRISMRKVAAINEVGNVGETAVSEMVKKWDLPQDWEEFTKLRRSVVEMKNNIQLYANTKAMDNLASQIKELEIQSMKAASLGTDRIASLRKIGKQKIASKDASANFGTGYVPVAWQKFYDGLKAAMGIEEAEQEPTRLEQLSSSASSMYHAAMATLAGHYSIFQEKAKGAAQAVAEPFERLENAKSLFPDGLLYEKKESEAYEDEASHELSAGKRLPTHTSNEQHSEVHHFFEDAATRIAEDAASAFSAMSEGLLGTNTPGTVEQKYDATNHVVSSSDDDRISLSESILEDEDSNEGEKEPDTTINMPKPSPVDIVEPSEDDNNASDGMIEQASSTEEGASDARRDEL